MTRWTMVFAAVGLFALPGCEGVGDGGMYDGETDEAVDEGIYEPAPVYEEEGAYEENPVYDEEDGL